MAVTLLTNVHQYHALLTQKKLLEKRLAELNSLIKDQMLEQNTSQEVHPGESLTYEEGSIKATLQFKTSSKNIDELELENVIFTKGLWEECTKRVVDHDLVAQAYIEGKLTDEDMRRINKTGEVTLALRVEEVQEKDVQGVDEGLC